MPKKKAPNNPPLETYTFAEHFSLAEREKILRKISRSDPKLALLIKSVGKFKLEFEMKDSPYERLIRSILHQQLHGKAAATIHSRLRDLFGGRDPKPEELLKTDDKPLLAAGLSRNKLLALKDLARAAKAGEVPTRKQALNMSNEELIESLIKIRGIGRWTVEMLLIFGLGRLDILAVDDFALKKSTMLLHGLDKMPTSKEFAAIGEKWSPYRSVISWYLWRSLDAK